MLHDAFLQPYLVAEFVAANLWSMLLFVGESYRTTCTELDT